MAFERKPRTPGELRPGIRRFVHAVNAPASVYAEGGLSQSTASEPALASGKLSRIVLTFFLYLQAGVASLQAQFPPTGPPQPRQSRESPGSAIAPQDRQANRQPAPVPTSRPGEFQPGVTIDWSKKTVLVRASLVLRSGPIEFLACRPGKEHESLLLMHANASHVFMALGLIGLEPGIPPKWDEKNQRMSAARGELVDVSFSWVEDGKTKSANWNEWVLDAEFLRPPVARPFVFAGSVPRPDGSVACERSGAVLALVDMPDSLISAARSHSEREADLWALTNPSALPAAGAEVLVSIRAAEKRRWEFSLGPRGDLLIDGRVERIDDAVELIRHQRRFFPDEQIVIQNNSPLRTDEWRLQDRLREAGIGDSAVRFTRKANDSANK